MKNLQKGSIAIWIAIVVLILLGVGFYFYSQNKNLGASSYPVQDNLISGDQAAPQSNPLWEADGGIYVDWKTYTNEKFGFSFKYPPEWTTKILRSDTQGSAITEFLDKKGRHVFTLDTPIREIGHEWANPVGKAETIKVTGGNIVKAEFKDNESPNTVYIYLKWNEENWNKSGEIWFSYEKGDQEKATNLTGILSTFKFTN